MFTAIPVKQGYGGTAFEPENLGNMSLCGWVKLKGGLPVEGKGAEDS